LRGYKRYKVGWVATHPTHYLRAAEKKLGENPLLDRFGRRLDDLRVPLRVVLFEPVRDIEEVRSREHFRQTGVSSDSDDLDKTARRGRRKSR